MKNLALCLVVLAALNGCATMKSTVTEKIPGSEGKPDRQVTMQMEYHGTADGVRVLADAETRRVQTVQAGEVAQAAIAKGLPATLGQDAQRSDTQAGYTYGYGAFGYGYGNAYGNPQLAAAEAMSLSYPSYQLPVVQQPAIVGQPAPVVVQTNTQQVGGGVPNLEQRLRDVEQDTRENAKRLIQLRRSSRH